MKKRSHPPDTRQTIDVSMPNRKTPAAPTAGSQSTELQCELAFDFFRDSIQKAYTPTLTLPTAANTLLRTSAGIARRKSLHLQGWSILGTVASMQVFIPRKGSSAHAGKPPLSKAERWALETELSSFKPGMFSF
jgi:hypothetical protein